MNDTRDAWLAAFQRAIDHGYAIEFDKARAAGFDAFIFDSFEEKL